MLEFRVLGALRVLRDGDDLHVGGPRQRRLLVALLIDRNRVVSTDRLVEAVFAGDPTPRAASTLRTYVMRLRKVVEDDREAAVLETEAPGYVLRVVDDELDAAMFERLVVDGRDHRAAGDPVGAASAFREALDLWGGEAYAEFDAEPWVLPEAQRLAQLRSVTEEQLVDAELACGLSAELVSRLESMVERDPLRESVRAKLMVALYRSGRQADALEVAREYRGVLGRETGLEPSPELGQLEQQILAHDDELRRAEPPARVVRGYRLGERLGSGRDGTVHAARLPGVERDLVIRVVPAEIADRPDVVRSFDAVSRRVAALHHDAIVPIDDHWREAGAAYVVLRRMRGGTLRDRMERGALSVQAVVDVARRVGSALEAAAGAGIVHGRVIPESVLFDDVGSAYLSDFPLAEVDGQPSDDVMAFASMIHEVMTDRRGADRGETAPQSPGVEVLGDAVSAGTPPMMVELLADFERAIGVSTPTAPRTNPYKGLRAFDESDAADFFGREQLVDELVDRLDAPGARGRLVLVVGASGSGKSSVVRAGLLPRVRAGAVAGSDRWLVTTMVPGAAPFEELAESLQQVATAPVEGARRGSGRDPARPVAHEQLARDLAQDEDGIARALRRLLPDGGDVLLVVDQLEELFTLAVEEVQRDFLDGLMRALSAPDGRLRVVATLRADFYDRPLRFQRLGAAVHDATVTVSAMTPAQLEATITGPAGRAGLEVEPALVAELVAAVVDQPAAMPSLQFTLYELAEAGDGALAMDAYRLLGGVGAAIAARAETLYRSVRDDQELVRHLFEQLVVIGHEGQPTRRPTPRSELARLADGRGLDGVIEPWVSARLLTKDRHPETREPTVEVAHEALLREWPRLRGWVEAGRAAIVAAGELRDAARSWEALDRDPGALHRGAKLETALQQLGGRVDTLPETARAFLDASLAARDERREREAERIARQTRTNRRLRRQLAALAVATVVALVGGVVALDQRARARDDQRVAVAQELAAESVAVLDQDPELSILLALEAVERTRAADGTVLPEVASSLHRAVTASRVVMSIPGLAGAVDWHPDGEVFVTAGPEGSGSVDLRDASTGDVLRTLAGHDADVNDVVFSADGSLLATAGSDGRLRVWDYATGDLRSEVVGGGRVWGVSFSPDGTRVAAGWFDDGVVRIDDLTDHGPPLTIPRMPTNPNGDGTSFGPDGQRLAIADITGVVVVDATTGDHLLDFQPSTNPLADAVFAVAWSPDGRWIASSSRGLTTRVTDAETGERHLDLAGHTDEVKAFDWSPDGSRLATGSLDGTARVWEVTDAGVTEDVVLTARAGVGGGVAFSPDGGRLLTGDTDATTAMVWDVGVGGGGEVLNVPTSPHVQATAEFTPDGEELVVTDAGGAAAVWDLATGVRRQRLGPGQPDAWEVDVNPTGDLVATIGLDLPPRARVWDRGSGEEVFAVEREGFYPEELAWSPDGELLAVSSLPSLGPEGGAVLIVDRSGREVAELVDEEPGHQPRHLEFSPDGERLITQRLERGLDEDAPGDGVRVWDWERGEIITDVEVPTRVVTVDPAGTRIAVGGAGSRASIWDLETGERLVTLTGHDGQVSDVAFSPDGDTIATAATDGSVRLWHADSGLEQLVLDGHDGPVASVAFSPDGDRLASTSVGVARVWTVDLGDLVDLARRRLTRSLTDDECRQYLDVERCSASGDPGA